MEFYKLKIDPREVNATIVLDRLNKDFDVSITEKDINTEAVSKEVTYDKDMATKSMVSGTPTVFIDGKWDPSRNVYKSLIK